MKKALMLALSVLMIFAFISCDDSNQPQETVLVSWNTPEALTAIYTTYSENIESGESGIILKAANSASVGGVETTGPSTYFGEADKNYDWNGSKLALRFTLDASTLTSDKAVSFVLGFNKTEEESFSHVDEIRFGVTNSGNTFYANELSGINHGEIEKDISEIKAGKEISSVDSVPCEFVVSYDAESDTFTYSISAGGVNLAENKTRTEVADIVGLRYLWAASLNGEVEISNLEIVSL